MKRHAKYCGIVLGLLLPGAVMASTWVGGTGDWSVGANWGPVGVPGSLDDTLFTEGGAADQATLSATAASAKLVMENGAGLTIASGGNLSVGGQALLGNADTSVGSTILVDGGQLSVGAEFAFGVTGGASLTIANAGTVNANGAWLIPGYQPGSTGAIVVDGTLNSAGPLYVGFKGNGTLTVNGGNVNLSSHLIVGSEAGSTGNLVINGGVTTTIALNLGAGGGTQTLHLNGGQLVTTGGFADGANLTVYVGSGELIFKGGQPLEDVQDMVANGAATWIFEEETSIEENPDGSITVTSIPRPPTEKAVIVSLSAVSNDVMKIVVNTPSPPERYHPESSTDLSVGTWGSVPHSDDGVNAFIITNLDYSTSDGTNAVIYVQAADVAGFFKFEGVE